MARSFKKRSGKKTKRVKKAIKKRRGTKGLVKTMKKIAAAAVHKQAEDKILVTNLIPVNALVPVSYSTMDGNGNIPPGLTGWFQGVIPGQGLGPGGTQNQPFLPSIIQGSGQGAREGNRITVRSFMIRGVITAQFSIFNQTNQAWEENANPNPEEAPVYVHCLIWNRKDQMTGTQAGDSSRILQGGTGPGTALPIDGSLIRMQYPFNRDAYVIHMHKRFRIAIPPNTGTGTIAAPVFVDRDGWGNGFKCSVPFKFKLKSPKVWKYDDTVASGPTLQNLPTNYNPIISWYTVNADGSFDWTQTPPSPAIYDITKSRVQVQMETVLRYEDV